MKRKPCYWYVSRNDEIFCDLDTKRSLSRAFNVLRRAIRRKLLSVRAIYFYPSASHYHLVIQLKTPLDRLHRALWALWMGSDRLRGVYVMERYRRGVEAADVLSNPHLFKHRPPDDICHCSDKHKRKAVTQNCPAMKRLMMDERSGDYFPRNFDRKERKALKVPYGKVPKTLLMEY